jgi:predicted ATP-grasp superfamily ATP-dependent carboligase
MVLRPAHAVDRLTDRLAKSNNVFCAGPDDWHEARSSFPPDRPILAQRIISGQGIGVFGLARNGTLHAASGHRRVRPTDPAGSGASAAAARRVDADELAQAETFVARTGWDGILMIEQIVRPQDGSRWFVEINARPWGSTALARRRGLEYPAMAVDAALGLEVDPPPHRLDDDGTVARHLGREVVHFLMVMRGPRVPDTTPWPTRRRTTVEMLRWGRGTHWYNKQPGAARLWAVDAANNVMDRVAPRKNRR